MSQSSLSAKLSANPEPAFPTLRITADSFSAQGAFAEAQAAYLQPDAARVRALNALLRSQSIGVVAHFYMDPELQGVLAACDWPHIHVSDSLVMADRAITMAQAGVQNIVVLGVDFMSENVRAMLDAAGFAHVPVYRVAAEPIGCSLAEAAEAQAYGAYLTEAAHTSRSLHVVYINTSLVTKAKAHALVPTITCTSSNVVQTVLQAAAQVPGVHIWFGPDTYMGQNLHQLFTHMATMEDAAIAAIHPAHNQQSIATLLQHFRHFAQGTCIVHHMFGKEVVARVEQHYPSAYITAHLEVPGDMFTLGLEAQQQDRGVVGSTSNILGFITQKVRQHIQKPTATHPDQPIAFILGTEAGMITPIARQVQNILREHQATQSSQRTDTNTNTNIDIVFPVSTEAIAVTDDASLPVVPGVTAGEGCSTAGGCATCPYMKMNSLDALLALATRLDANATNTENTLQDFYPKTYPQHIQGRTVADLGGEPILHMRSFQTTGTLPEALIDDIVNTHA